MANADGQLGKKLKDHLAFVESIEKLHNEEKKRNTTWLDLFWGLYTKIFPALPPGHTALTFFSPLEGNDTSGEQTSGHNNEPSAEDLVERMDFEEIKRPEETDDNDVTEEVEIEVWRTNWLWRRTCLLI